MATPGKASAWQPTKRRDANTIAKLACVVFIIIFYLIYSAIHSTTPYPVPITPTPRLKIQYAGWKNETRGEKIKWKQDRVVRAMRITYDNYKDKAWSHDEILPLSGGNQRSRNAWGVFIVDAASTLALMRMTEELEDVVKFIAESINFNNPVGLVDAFETTIRYLGGILSLIDLIDNGILPTQDGGASQRGKLVAQAQILADNLLHAYDTPTGLPWPNVDFGQHTGRPREWQRPDEPTAVGPARAGSNILEYCVLSNLTGDPRYCKVGTRSWSSFVWSKYTPSIPGLVDGPKEVMGGVPVNREAHWDAGHDSYYEYLLKTTILFPNSPHNDVYKQTFLRATEAVRWNLTSRSEPSSNHKSSHLFMGRWTGPWFLNEQTHLSCFVPGTLMLGSKALDKPDLMSLGKAILEGCRHAYASTTTGLGPEAWSWIPATSDKVAAKLEFQGKSDTITFAPTTLTSKQQLADHGFWISDHRYNLRPEYVESLFYAYRITGEERYRDWAWDAFVAMEKYCKVQYGYAVVDNVMADPPEDVDHIDRQESFWAAETLKYLYLIFDDVDFLPLEDWVFTTEGHPLRRRA